MRWDVQWAALQDGEEAGLGRGTKMDCDAATSEAWACPKSGAGTAPQRCPKLKQRAEPLHSQAGGQWTRLPLWRMMDNVGQGPPPPSTKGKTWKETQLRGGSSQYSQQLAGCVSQSGKDLGDL